MGNIQTTLQGGQNADIEQYQKGCRPDLWHGCHLSCIKPARMLQCNIDGLSISLSPSKRGMVVAA
ncbi:hypothetical protein [Simplicispira hankyongi]|uniref:hypothetical protein n=1 Tax=Simplicispira hankyongi TaxID=2315688 RepID=UPI0011C3C0D9|nr:hypothetical protein [Simplicispira hankyongi]